MDSSGRKGEYSITYEELHRLISESKEYDTQSFEDDSVELETISELREQVSLPKLEEYIQLVREKLTDLDFNMKRLALDMLSIKIWYPLWGQLTCPFYCPLSCKDR